MKERQYNPAGKEIDIEYYLPEGIDVSKMILIFFNALMFFFYEWVFIYINGEDHEWNKADEEGKCDKEPGVIGSGVVREVEYQRYGEQS